MASLNQCNFIGRVGRDPETRYSQSGDAITNITLAVDDSYKDKSGAKVDKCEWVNVTFYRKLAEIAGEYLVKGSLVYVSGKIETRKYTDKNGVEKYSTSIIANSMQMLGSKQGNSDQRESFENNPSTANERSKARSSNASSSYDMDDDIPF